MVVLIFIIIVCFVISMYDDFWMDCESIFMLLNNVMYNLFFINFKCKMFIVKVVLIESVILEGICNVLLLVDFLI